jgi:hypothetical protein
MAETGSGVWSESEEFMSILTAAASRPPLLEITKHLRNFFIAYPTIYPDDVELELRRIRLLVADIEGFGLSSNTHAVVGFAKVEAGQETIDPSTLELFEPPAKGLQFPLWLFGCDIPKEHAHRFDLLDVHCMDKSPKPQYMIVTSTYFERSACPEYNSKVADPAENLKRLRQSGWLLLKQQ